MTIFQLKEQTYIGKMKVVDDVHKYAKGQQLANILLLLMALTYL